MPPPQPQEHHAPRADGVAARSARRVATGGGRRVGDRGGVLLALGLLPFVAALVFLLDLLERRLLVEARPRRR